MSAKPRGSGRRKGEPAVEVFRQFAWNLAGTLAKTTTQQKPRPEQRPRPGAEGR